MLNPQKMWTAAVKVFFMRDLILQSAVQTQFPLTSVRADSVACFSGLVYNWVMFVTKAKIFAKVSEITCVTKAIMVLWNSEFQPTTKKILR